MIYPLDKIKPIAQDGQAVLMRLPWTLIEMFNELKMLFWTLFDRRYHMAWATRVVISIILAAILLSHWWLPFAFDNVIGRLWEKIINLLLGFVMFFILHFEMRRYQEWLGKRP